MNEEKYTKNITKKITKHIMTHNNKHINIMIKKNSLEYY
jgi:hypothetical protein